ncbi:GNAT family N-acetyltransferase [Secundilactobacillus hailunensis]|uniref:GNAT family N-acetyltransferase n=1 Tax=Secundilactobacillus hailunensis TaxID=2559923 RepID=A0ABW1T5D7_9LACO|nr:GNAT family N-acetyltransferase [Secundilactobacillus hailunensis]
MTAVTIEPANENSDFDAIRQVYYQTWLATYQNQLPSTILKRLTPATWQPEQRWQNMQLALTDTNQIVGVCSYGPARLAAWSAYGELYSIYILPEYQHQGLGKRLIEPVLKALTAKYQQIYLEVLTTNLSAQQFYTRMGFYQTETNRVTNVPGGKLRTAVFEMASADNVKNEVNK